MTGHHIRAVCFPIAFTGGSKMQRFTSLGLAALSAAAFGTLAGTASAAPITLFSDNFENVTVGSLPSPTVGSFVNQGNGSTFDSNGLVGGTSGAQVLRVEGSGVGNRNGGRLATPAGAGEVFRMTFDYAVDVAGVGFGFGSEVAGESGTSSGNSQPASGRPRQSFAVRLTGNQVQVFRDADGTGAGGNAYADTGLDYTTGEFQTYVVEYDFALNQLTLTAGTQTPVVISNPFVSINATTPVTALTQVDNVFAYTTSTGAAGRFDNLVVTGAPIPEPSTLAGLAGAGLLMVRRSRKQ